ncbi:MAG: lipopolysaccharide transport periplasmic protein LptA, partial [Desulfobulbus sp.]|nr:lipopolysaccharide transport periplasmic protein LptA [Desulfobulbus sp.]
MSLFLSATRRALAITVIALLPALACGAPTAGSSNEPINIEANRMVSQENGNSVVFIGNVEAKQGKLTIRSEEMTVFYTESKGGKDNATTSQMDRLICKNNVKITQEDWLGTGDRMDYFAKERKVILSGNAKTWQGPNMVSGKTIIYYLDEKRSV